MKAPGPRGRVAVKPGQLKQVRIAAGLSQRKLAEQAGCSQTAIHLLEAGRMPICTWKLALSIAGVLRVPRRLVFAEPVSAANPAASERSTS
ncbi:MAG: helix-turn-helix transcriptional regulator [Acidimicrobiales bacterium]